MNRAFQLFLILALMSFLGCAQTPNDEASTSTLPHVEDGAIDPDVIAIFDEGQITAGELDQAVLAFTPAQRQTLTGDSESFRNMVRELAVDKILLREAKLLGVDQSPEHLDQVRSIRRNLIVGRYLQDHMPPIHPPTEDELKAEYQRRIIEYQRSDRRLVHNLFKRLSPGVSKDDLRAELRDLRQQALDGQSFTYLAENHSDSESRHNQGILGWFERGQLAPQLEEIVFGLEEGIPSEPIATRDGVHLFYVDVAIEGKDFAFEEMRKTLVGQFQIRRRAEAMRRLEDELADNLEVFFPSPEELQTIEQRGDPRALLLRVGDFELRQNAFAAMLENDRTQRPGAVKDRKTRLLETVRQTERIYQQELASGTTLEPEKEAQLAAQADRLLAVQYRQEKLKLAVESDPARLQRFFKDNRQRFTSPLRVQLLRLSLPLDDQSAAHMATLEELKPELDAGTKTLEEAATNLSAKLERLDLMTLQQLEDLEPKLLLFAGGLATGGHSPPFTTEGHIEMLKVVSRKEPEPLAYEQVRGAVQVAFGERHLQRMYEELRVEVLENANFRVLEERLESLTKSGLHPEAPSSLPKI